MAYFKTGFLNDKRILVTNLKWAEGGGVVRGHSSTTNPGYL